MQIQIKNEGENINQVEKGKSLDVLIDDNLPWKNRVDEISLALAP